MSSKKTLVKTRGHGSIMTIELNRPRVLNSLNLEMVRQVTEALQRARSTAGCKCVLLLGAGDRAFCAGGDVKVLAKWVREEKFDAAQRFFEEEYALDLLIHEYPKPILVVADGIVMGGGLGLAAGADVVIATERTRMAMPETSIGFFPDVGATGWLFSKCAAGYPEYIGLTGYEMRGEEAVRCGLATHLVAPGKLAVLLSTLKSRFDSISEDSHDALTAIRVLIEAPRSTLRGIFDRKEANNFSIRSLTPQQAAGNALADAVQPHCEMEIPERPDLDTWVEKHFSGKSSLQEIFDSLRSSRSKDHLCRQAQRILAERSPTALVVTFTLFKVNQGRPLEEVFETELKASRFMIRHPDYLEGVRARVLDKDNHPHWRPKTIEEVEDTKQQFS